MKVKLLRDGAEAPYAATSGSAGFDLKACFDEVPESGMYAIAPHTTIKVPTGIAVAIPEGCFGAVFARSGLSLKEGLRPANCVGVIDSDYRGEIIVALHNDTDHVGFVSQGERIAQLIIMPYISTNIEVVSELDETTRGNGGFGSTGTN